eukprot:IDg5259t1
MSTLRKHTISKCRQRREQWESVLIAVARSGVTSGLEFAGQEYINADVDLANSIRRSPLVSTSSFDFNFNAFSEGESLHQFRFRKEDVLRMCEAVAWPSSRTHTERNRYSVSPLLATCVLLRRLASPTRWRDVEVMFGKPAEHLSEIFWEALERFMDVRDLSHGECVGFIDGTVIGIARPSGAMEQRVAYNGHKRKHALKYQATTAPDGLIIHGYGPVEGRRHDWTLCTRSGLEQTQPTVLINNGTQYCLYGDSGYVRRWFLQVPYDGSNINVDEREMNKAMSAARVSVEWIFKEVKLYYNTLDFKRKLKVFESPVVLPMHSAKSGRVPRIYRHRPIKHFEHGNLRSEEQSQRVPEFTRARSAADARAEARQVDIPFLHFPLLSDSVAAWLRDPLYGPAYRSPSLPHVQPSLIRVWCVHVLVAPSPAQDARAPPPFSSFPPRVGISQTPPGGSRTQCVRWCGASSFASRPPLPPFPPRRPMQALHWHLTFCIIFGFSFTAAAAESNHLRVSPKDEMCARAAATSCAIMRSSAAVNREWRRTGAGGGGAHGTEASVRRVIGTWMRSGSGVVGCGCDGVRDLGRELCCMLVVSGCTERQRSAGECSEIYTHGSSLTGHISDRSRTRNVQNSTRVLACK